MWRGGGRGRSDDGQQADECEAFGCGAVEGEVDAAGTAVVVGNLWAGVWAQNEMKEQR
jgi:hypothetical protein